MAISYRTLNSVTATYTGTGASLALDLGFVPSFCHAADVTSGGDGWFWFSNQDGTTSTTRGFTEGLAVGTISNGAGGITALDGSAGTGIGLTVGTNTTINATGHGYVVFAQR